MDVITVEQVIAQLEEASIDLESFRVGCDWYPKINRWAGLFAGIHGLSEAQVAGLIAVFSPRCQWKQNIKRVVQFVTTGKVGAFGSAIKKATKIVALPKDHDEHDVSEIITGIKENSFFWNIMLPLMALCVTVDTIICQWVGLDQGKLKNKGGRGLPTNYERIEQGFQIVADRLGILASQLQAAVWVMYRGKAF